MGYTVNEMIGKNHKEFQGNGIRLEATYMPVFANDAKKSNWRIENCNQYYRTSKCNY